MSDTNSIIAVASRLLEGAIEAQREKGGPNYRHWEDDLAPALERYANAIVVTTIAQVEERIQALVEAR